RYCGGSQAAPRRGPRATALAARAPSDGVFHGEPIDGGRWVTDHDLPGTPPPQRHFAQAEAATLLSVARACPFEECPVMECWRLAGRHPAGWTRLMPARFSARPLVRAGSGGGFVRKYAGNPWMVLLVVSLGFFMTLLDLTIVNIAIPNMITKLHASLDD